MITFFGSQLATCCPVPCLFAVSLSLDDRKGGKHEVEERRGKEEEEEEVGGNRMKDRQRRGLLSVCLSTVLTRMRVEWVQEVINWAFLPSPHPPGRQSPSAAVSMQMRFQSETHVRFCPDVKVRNRVARLSKGPCHSCYTGLSFIAA